MAPAARSFPLLWEFLSEGVWENEAELIWSGEGSDGTTSLPWESLRAFSYSRLQIYWVGTG